MCVLPRIYTKLPTRVPSPIWTSGAITQYCPELCTMLSLKVRTSQHVTCATSTIRPRCRRETEASPNSAGQRDIPDGHADRGSSGRSKDSCPRDQQRIRQKVY